MNRSKNTTIAAILLFAYSAVNAILEVPNLASGAATGSREAPFALTLFSFALGLSGVFAAYGLWKNQKWGKVLGVALPGISIIYSLVPLLVAPPPMKVLAGAGMAISIVIITMVLRREPQRGSAAEGV